MININEQLEAIVFKKLIPLIIISLIGTVCTANDRNKNDSMFVLNADAFKYHVDLFNTMEPENIVNYIPNNLSWPWITVICDICRDDLLFEIEATAMFRK